MKFLSVLVCFMLFDVLVLSKSDSDTGNAPNAGNSSAPEADDVIDPEEEFHAKEDPRVRYNILKQSSDKRIEVTKDVRCFVAFTAHDTETGELIADSHQQALKDGGDPEKDSHYIFNMNMNSCIRGLEYGIMGMRQGETRRVFVPGDLVTAGTGLFSEKHIPWGRDTTFEITVQMLLHNYESSMPNMFKIFDDNGDGYIDREEMALYLIDEGVFGEGHALAMQVNRFMARDDNDGDKRVSWEEFKGPKGTKDEL